LTEYKTQWYTTKVSSYSKTSSKEIMEFDYQNGDFEWYEGNMIDEEVLDSVTHSLDFIDSSLISEEKNLRKIIKDNISKV
jgi:cell division FtsZ-interacting protein ZapD